MTIEIQTNTSDVTMYRGIVRDDAGKDDCHMTKMGNTNIRRLGCWDVKIISIDSERRTAMASWNGNAPRRYSEHQIKPLRRSKPKP